MALVRWAPLLLLLWVSAGSGDEGGAGVYVGVFRFRVDPWRIRFPLRFSGGGGSCDVVSGKARVRLALVLLALGKDLLCSPVSLPFLAGDFIAGCGISFLLLDGGLDFPCVGLLSWVMLDVAPVDFFWVAGSVGGASFVLFQGQDDDGRCAPEGGTSCG